MATNNTFLEELLFNSIKNGQQPVRSVYDIWLDLGNTGTPQDFIESLRGKSAYEYARDAGYTGTEAEFTQLLIGKPDLNQNNVSHPDYIKNRTHWIEGETTIYPTGNIEMDAFGEFVLNSKLNIQSGKVYRVKWNENTYTCIAQKKSDGAIGIGSGYGNNEAPFVVSVGSNSTIIGSYDGSSVVLFSITEEKIQKLHKKFIPEDAEFIIPSSTFGSTKKFKISINDAGVISAVEVK